MESQYDKDKDTLKVPDPEDPKYWRVTKKLHLGTFTHSNLI